MATVSWTKTAKQEEAWKYLFDPTVTELVFGGGAGGGKTFFGCAWLIYMCGAYHGSRWLMGRNKLSDLKETTLATFYDLTSKWSILQGTHFNYNGQDKVITFNNGSEILLKDLFSYPADPNFDRLGSLELTGAFIDEASQVAHKAKDIISSRIRYRLTDFKLTPKLLMTCNPTKNHLYHDFYKPWREGNLKEYRRFVQSLYSDNIDPVTGQSHLPASYVTQLQRLDKNSRERLMLGNWEFDDDPTRMFEIDAIQDMFTKDVVTEGPRAQRYLSVDVARHGSDKTVIQRWEGLQVREIENYQGWSTAKTVDRIKKLASDFDIGRSHIVVDEDGIGGGVVDQLPGCHGFLNGGKIIENGASSNYSNLKTQCYFKLAELVKNRKIGIECSADQRDALTEELEQIKEKRLDPEGKIAILSKEEIREVLGRSPDYADALMMRMVFELSNPGSLASLSNSEYNKNNTSIAGDLMKAIF